MLWTRNKQVSCILRFFRNKFVPKNMAEKEHPIYKFSQNYLHSTNMQLKYGAIKLRDIEYVKDLSKTEHPSEEAFQQLREHSLRTSAINEDSVDAIIFRELLFLKKAETALSYISFLKSHNYPLNIGLKALYLKTLVLTKSFLSETEEKEIMEFYEEAKREGAVAIPDIQKSLVIILSKSSRPEECLNYIENMFEDDEEQHQVCQAFVNAAIKQGKVELGMKQFRKVLQSLPKADYASVMIEYINYIQKTKSQSKFNKAIDEMFSLWSKFNMFPTKNTIDVYIEVCKKFGWDVNHAKISTDGACPVCKKLLTQRIGLRDFEKLRKCITSNKFFGENVYQTTTPTELIEFRRFVAKTGPYDVVIDGLNVLHISKLLTLQEIALSFVKQKKKVLIIGRKHIYYTLKQWKADVFYYLLNNLSLDDKFVLYASFASGHNTVIVSLDLMRQHKHQLGDPTMQLLFERWQWCHQYTIKRTGGQYRLIEPLVYEPYTQKNDNTWHIPYDISKYHLIRPNNWVCLTRKNI